MGEVGGSGWGPFDLVGLVSSPTTFTNPIHHNQTHTRTRTRERDEAPRQPRHGNGKDRVEATMSRQGPHGPPADRRSSKRRFSTHHHHPSWHGSIISTTKL